MNRRQDGVFLCWRDATLYDTDIEALQTQGSWLNDNHISFAEEVFANDFGERFAFVHAPACFILMHGDDEDVADAVRSLHIADKDAVFFPVNDSAFGLGFSRMPLKKNLDFANSATVYEALDGRVCDAVDSFEVEIAEQVGRIDKDHAVLLLGGGDDIRRAVDAAVKQGNSQGSISLGQLQALAKAAKVDLPMAAVRATDEKFYDALSNGCDDLLRELGKVVARTADKLEVYLLRNILHVPETLIVDPEVDEAAAAAADVPFDETSEKALDESRLALRTEIIKMRRETAAMESSTRQLRAQITKVDNHAQKLLRATSTLSTESGFGKTMERIIQLSDRLGTVSGGMRLVAAELDAKGPKKTSILRNGKRHLRETQDLDRIRTDFVARQNAVSKVSLQQLSQINKRFKSSH
eukprot:g4937.t1